MNSASGDRIGITAKSATIVTLLSAGYLLLAWLLIGFKPDEVVLVAIFNVCFYASAISRKFILGFSIFIVYWVLFDFMKAFPNYTFSAVHIESIYNFEKSLFGIPCKGHVLTPNEYWLVHSSQWLDVVTGLFYLCWIPVPLGFATYLFFTRKPEFLRFALTFFTVNLLGFVVYYTFPAAPPWYVQLHGFEFIANTPGNTGGLARFDSVFHIALFKSIYAKGSNVFAAMPSLHSAYPIIVVYYALRNKVRWGIVAFTTVMLGIWFTAVYASHHYIVDVLAGIVCAIAGMSLFNFVASLNGVQKFLNRYATIIS